VSVFTEEEEEMASTKGTKVTKATRKTKASAKARRGSGVIRGKVPQDKVDQMIACISGVLATHEPGDYDRPGRSKIVSVPMARKGTGASAQDELSLTVFWVR
jgi:hypothetical protein